MDNGAQISEAIVSFVSSGWSRDVERQVREAFGEETVEQVRAVYDRAMNCPLDWNAKDMNMNSALAILADFMETELAWLSPAAKTRLNYCYIMAWK